MEPSRVTAQKKSALLLHLAAPEVQDLYDTREQTRVNIDDIINDLNTYFAPRKNFAFERHLFSSYQTTQNEKETVLNYKS